MAETNFTQADAGALEDWMGEVFEISQSMRFLLEMQDDVDPAKHHLLLQSLRLMNVVLMDKALEGSDRFVF